MIIDKMNIILFIEEEFKKNIVSNIINFYCELQNWSM